MQHLAAAYVEISFVARAFNPVRGRRIIYGAGQVGAFLLVGKPLVLARPDQDEGHLGAFQRERMGRPDRHFMGLANLDFASQFEWRQNVVFHRDPAAAGRHAAGYQAEEFGELTPGDVLGLHSFDREIDLISGFWG